jgi:pilus assembly protein Flp/PilA
MIGRRPLRSIGRGGQLLDDAGAAADDDPISAPSHVFDFHRIVRLTTWQGLLVRLGIMTQHFADLQVFLARLIHDRRGVTILEYGLILAVMSLVILAVASLFGSEVIDNFNALSGAVEQADARGDETAP